MGSILTVMKGRKVTDETPISNSTCTRPRRTYNVKSSQSKYEMSGEPTPRDPALTKQRADFETFPDLTMPSLRVSSKASTRQRSTSHFNSRPAWAFSFSALFSIWLQRRLVSLLTAQALLILRSVAVYLLPLLLNSVINRESPLCGLQRLSYYDLPIHCGLENPIKQKPIRGSELSLASSTLDRFKKLPGTITIVARLVTDIDQATHMNVSGMDFNRDFKPLVKKLRVGVNSETRARQIDHLEQSIATFHNTFRSFAAEGKTLYDDCRVSLFNQIYYDISSYHTELLGLQDIQNESFHVPIYEWIPWLRTSQGKHHVKVTRDSSTASRLTRTAAVCPKSDLSKTCYHPRPRAFRWPERHLASKSKRWKSTGSRKLPPLTGGAASAYRKILLGSKSFAHWSRHTSDTMQHSRMRCRGYRRLNLHSRSSFVTLVSWSTCLTVGREHRRSTLSPCWRRSTTCIYSRWQTCCETWHTLIMSACLGNTPVVTWVRANNLL